MTITCHFNQTGSTEVQVTPAAAAQPSGTASQTAEPPVDNLTDDFAAGDAAVQVPVRSLLISCYECAAAALHFRIDLFVDKPYQSYQALMHASPIITSA